VQLNLECGASPLDAETIHGLEHGAPVFFKHVGAVEDEGDRDALAGGERADVGFVGNHYAHLGADFGVSIPLTTLAVERL